MINSVGKLAGLEISGSLDEMWPRYPEGMTIRDLEQETGLPYHTVHAAAVWIVEAKKAQWIQRPDRKAAILVPLKWEAPTWNLTQKQERVLKAIIAAADEDGISQISYREMSEGGNASPGSITAHIDALDRKGYLEIVSVGGPNEIGRYKAYPGGDGPKGYSKRPLSFSRSA